MFTPSFAGSCLPAPPVGRYTGNRQAPPRANSITLGDDVAYQQILIAFNQTMPMEINPRTCDSDTDGFTVTWSDGKRMGFCGVSRPSSSSSARNFYAVELQCEATAQLSSLRQYLLCDSPEAWGSHIDALLAKEGHTLNNLSALPNRALVELSNEQRLLLIEKVANSQKRDYYPLINRVIANVGTEDIEPFIAMLDEGTRIMDLCGMLSRAPFRSDDYDDFMMELFKLYYKQQPTTALTNLVSLKGVFTWHRSKDFNILYDASFTGDGRVTFSGVLDHLTENGNRRETIFDYHPATTIHAMDIIGVNLTTRIDFIGVEGLVLPMPAIFFKWIVDKHREGEIRDMINLGFSVASFCFAYNEVTTALKLGSNGMKLALRLAGFLQASGDLFMEFNDDVKNELLNSKSGSNFLNFWNIAGILLNGETAIERIANKNIPVFLVLKFSWDGMTAIEKSHFSEQEHERIEELMSVINESLNDN